MSDVAPCPLDRVEECDDPLFPMLLSLLDRYQLSMVQKFKSVLVPTAASLYLLAELRQP